MATITVRNIPDEVIQMIKSRARRNRRSMEQRRYVVDTNVLAYYAFATTPFSDELSVLFSQPFELFAPDSCPVYSLWREALQSAVRLIPAWFALLNFPRYDSTLG